MLQEEFSGFFNNTPAEIQTDSNLVSSSSDFACCSRYQECSDAKSCLIPDIDYSQSCAYRKKLESGTIYYGKNASNFSSDAYSAYLKRSQSLDSASLSLLYQILSHFFYYEYCVPFVLAYRNDCMKHLAKLEFVDIRSSREYVLQNYKNEALESAVLQSSDKISARWEAEKAAAKSLAKESGKSFAMRPILNSWLKTQASDLLDSISDQYCVVRIPLDNRQYAIELYNSCCRGHENNYKLDLPLKNDSSLFFAGKNN